MIWILITVITALVCLLVTNGVFLWVVIMNITEINEHIYQVMFDLKGLLHPRKKDLKDIGEALIMKAEEEARRDTLSKTMNKALRAFSKLSGRKDMKRPLEKKIEGILGGFSMPQDTNNIPLKDYKMIQGVEADGGFIIVNPNEEDRELVDKLSGLYEYKSHIIAARLIKALWSLLRVS